MATTKGTVAWAFLDDTGKRSVFTIPDVLHVPSLHGRLLSPQHWAQHIGHHAHCITTATAVHLIWQQGQGRAQKTVLLNEANIGVMRTAPSTKRFMAFKAQAHSDTGTTHPQNQVYCFPAVDSPEADDEASQVVPQTESSHTQAASGKAKEGERSSLRHLCRDENQGTPTTIPERPVPDATVELLRWHRRLGHLPYPMLQRMAAMGLLPKRLAQCPHPFCAACQYGKQTRRPWRTKPGTAQQTSLRQASRAGECVSVDQIEVSLPGFIAQRTNDTITSLYLWTTTVASVTCIHRKPTQVRRPCKRKQHSSNLRGPMGVELNTTMQTTAASWIISGLRT